MGKQSSVEWLIENYKQLYFDFQEGKINQSQFIPKKINIEEQAKAMHKEEIIKANRDGVDMVIDKKPFITGEEYYNETFGETIESYEN